MRGNLDPVGGKPLLRLSIPGFRYDEANVLEGIDLTVPGPGLVGLVGPNGSGKSTLLKLAAGLLHRPEIEVRVSGHSLTALSRRQAAQWISWVPQRGDGVFAMRVHEMVRVGRFRAQQPLRPLPAAEEMRIERAIEEIGLASLADRDVGTLSGGEWQRALIARAIAQETPILVLDEPVASLDLQHQEGVYRTLRRLAGDGRAVLVADHHLELAAAHVDRLLLMSQGAIVADGPPDQVLTEERIEAVFGVRVKVFADPIEGTPRLSRPLPGGGQA